MFRVGQPGGNLIGKLTGECGVRSKEREENDIIFPRPEAVRIRCIPS